jgi:hypothetical protein
VRSSLRCHCIAILNLYKALEMCFAVISGIPLGKKQAVPDYGSLSRLDIVPLNVKPNKLIISIYIVKE